MATAKKAVKKSATKKAAKKAAAKKRRQEGACEEGVREEGACEEGALPRRPRRRRRQEARGEEGPAKKAPRRRPCEEGPCEEGRQEGQIAVRQKFIGEMKARLEEERAKYLHSEETYRAEADALIEGREPGDVQFDEESGEGDTLAVERERDLALSNQARQAVEQIDAALGRIKAGTYGICVASGKSIPQERLRAIPWAAERVEYKVGGLGNRL